VNQPPPLEGYDLFTEDRPLEEAVFVASRVRGERGRAYGTLPESAGLAGIVERHRPLAVDQARAIFACRDASRW
jgi:hypothetical protein